MSGLVTKAAKPIQHCLHVLPFKEEGNSLTFVTQLATYTETATPTQRYQPGDKMNAVTFMQEECVRHEGHVADMSLGCHIRK